VTAWARRAGLAVLVVGALTPELAAACATCVSSSHGDRTYNWAYGGLLIAPILVALVVGAVLAWSAGYRLRWRRSTSRPMISRIPVHEERS
jgi:hypothetical protein